MMSKMDCIRKIPMLENFMSACTIEEQERFLAQVEEVDLVADETLFCEGEDPHGLYALVDGEYQVTKMIGGQSVVLATEGPGAFVGEISMLTGVPHTATARATKPSHFLKFDAVMFAEMRANPIVGAVITTMMQRLRNTESTVQHHEKLSALGRLSAGLAHELNNPASASLRAARQMPETVGSLQSLALKIHKLHDTPERIDFLGDYGSQLIGRAMQAQLLSPLEQSDREEAIADWIDTQSASDGIDDGWKFAATLVESGVTVDELKMVKEKLGVDALPDAMAWLDGVLTLTSLMRIIEQSTQRISELVKAVKDYTYMDQSPVQEVDIREGIENTLIILAHKLKNFTVVRDFAPDLPKITVHGSELNQVWTNLIDNAIDALEEHPPQDAKPTITIRTRLDNGMIKVQIMDNGPGIPAAMQSRVFEPFFTTKPVGKGTGLGLDIARKIITQHKGNIQLYSKPGETCFQMWLPVGE
jgi:signal transduction histidine kinase